MGISTFEIYFDKIKKILDNINDFCDSIKHENRISILKEEPDSELDYAIQQIKNIKIKGENDKEATKKKLIGYLYLKSIKILLQKKFVAIFQRLKSF